MFSVSNYNDQIVNYTLWNCHYKCIDHGDPILIKYWQYEVNLTSISKRYYWQYVKNYVSLQTNSAECTPIRSTIMWELYFPTDLIKLPSVSFYWENMSFLP